jgi:hypothetical protein
MPARHTAAMTPAKIKAMVISRLFMVGPPVGGIGMFGANEVAISLSGKLVLNEDAKGKKCDS